MNISATKKATATVLSLFIAYAASWLAFSAICVIFVIKVVARFASWIGIHGIADMLASGPLATLAICFVALTAALIATTALNGFSRQARAVIQRKSANAIAFLQEKQS